MGLMIGGGLMSSGIFPGYGLDSARPFNQADFAKLAFFNGTPGIDISVDNGATFVSYNFVDTLGASYIISSFDFVDNYAVISSRKAAPVAPQLQISDDYGQTFSAITGNLPNLDTNFTINDTVFKGGRLFVQYQNSSSSSEIYAYSDDYGLTFTTMSTNVGLPSAMHPISSTKASITNINNTLFNYVSLLNGVTITNTTDPTGLGLNDVRQDNHSLSVPPSTSSVVFGGWRYPTNSDIYITRSTDSGASFTATTIAGTYTKNPVVGGVTDTKVFVDYDSVLRVSTDAGHTFTPLTSMSGNTNFIKFDDSTYGTLEMGSSMYYTSDGGTTWDASTGTGNGVAYLIRSKTK